MYNKPLAYFLTFPMYGTWLHGDERKSIIVKDNTTKLIGRNDALQQYERNVMKYPVVALDESQRDIVLDTILKHCVIKNWQLYAAHIRSNHVHILLKSNENSDKVMKDLKAWATRKLREAGHTFEKVWARHGSTQYIFTWDKLKAKVHYVIHEQGEKMAYFADEGVL